MELAVTHFKAGIVIAARLEKASEEEFGLIERDVLPRGNILGAAERSTLRRCPVDLIRRNKAATERLGRQRQSPAEAGSNEDRNFAQGKPLNSGLVSISRQLLTGSGAEYSDFWRRMYAGN